MLLYRFLQPTFRFRLKISYKVLDVADTVRAKKKLIRIVKDFNVLNKFSKT